MEPTNERAQLTVSLLGAVLFVASLATGGCSNSSSSSDAGATGGSKGSGGSSGGTTGTGGKGGTTGAGGETGGATGQGGAAGGVGVSCGSTTPCAIGQVCVHPSCGGGTPPQCDPGLLDGGLCPSGWTYEPQCPPGSGTVPGCIPPACTPPGPYCVVVPAACSGAPSCSCLPSGVCQENGGSGSCQSATSTEVLCGSA